MKIILTSDIHKNKRLVDYILYNFDADYYLDCGDSELNNYELKNFETVLGNCDYENYPRYRIFSEEGLNILLTHGHLYSIDKMIELAKVNNCKIIIHGHTHIKKDEIIDDIIILNPGSITKPRNKNSNNMIEINYDSTNNKLYYNFIEITL